MGSSCFSRGNRLTLQILQKYLKDHHLEQDVILKGSHCFSDCSKGPILKIGQGLYEEVTPENVLEILTREFGEP